MPSNRPGLILNHLAAVLVAVALTCGSAAAEQTVRVGALQYGTVNWELDVIKHHALDQAAGIHIDVRPLGSANAAAVALQSGAVDAIVSDWIWVSRQRGNGRPWTFYPWSMTVGSVMVRPDSGIRNLADLTGRKLGVAGGPVDKSWLILRAYYRQRYGSELAEHVQPVFGAPPLLNKLTLRGELPAVINFWHYSARLRAAGMHPLIEVEDMLPALGVDPAPPLLGWVFSDRWAEKHPKAIRGLLRASYAAKHLLARSDAEWKRLEPLTGAEDDATLTALRDGFRAGIPESFGKAEIDAARKLFEVLAREGGETLTGGQRELAPGTFWQPPGGEAPWQRQ